MTDDLPSMLSDDRFEGHLDAQFMYALARPPVEALALFRRRLDDGSWLEAPLELVNAARCMEQQGRITLDDATDLYAQVVGALERAGARFEEGVHEALRVLVQALAEAPARHPILGRLVVWLCAHAGAGEARLVADLVTFAWTKDDEGGWGTPSVLHPLASWMLARGSAELRGRDRVILLAKVVSLAVDVAPDLFIPAIRLLVRSRDAVNYLPLPVREQVWRRLEEALCAGCSPSVAVDLAASFGAPAVGAVFVPGSPLVQVRRALVGGLLRGELEGGLARELCGWALASEAPNREVARRATLAALERTLDLLPFRVGIEDRPEQVGTAQVPGALMRPRPEFVAVLLDAWLDAIGIGAVRRPGAARNRLLMLAGYALTSPVVARCLRQRLLDAGEAPGSSLPLAILDGGSTDPVTTSAAVRALRSVRPPVGREERVVPPAFAAHLREVLNGRWDERTFGVDPSRLLGSAREVVFTALSSEDKVRIVDDALLIDMAYPLHLAGAGWTDEEQLALLTLYVLHELIHVGQGVGAKTAVQAIREAGAELSLMHIDLAADHAAALLTAVAVRRWHIHWLKELQGRSLVDFPVGPTHPSGSRARKAARLVGVRLDWMVRALEVVSPEVLGDSYAFAEFGPGGGQLLVLVSGPPCTLVACRALTGEAAQVLVAAADEANVGAAGLARLDAALRETLGVRLTR